MTSVPPNPGDSEGGAGREPGDTTAEVSLGGAPGPARFDASPQALEKLAGVVAEVAAIQAQLVSNDPALRHGDRVAHQQQIAGGLVELTVATDLPEDVRGIGLFDPGTVHRGIGRISSGLGCPHIETNPDFLGLMLAFRHAGRRIDFLAINDPAAPTDTVEEFVALLAATAESAGTRIPLGDLGQLGLGNLSAEQVKMFRTLRRRLGVRQAARIYAHVARQTARTLLSSTALQTYWTGVMALGDGFAKFALVPIEMANRHRAVRPGERYLTEDWRHRQSEAALDFRLLWIPYHDERATPTRRLSEAWSEASAREVGRVAFPRTPAGDRQSALLALLASEMGANPANWVSETDPRAPHSPATEFTAGRMLAYRLSQEGRAALPEARYQQVFETGRVDDALAEELLERYRANRISGHAGPDLGELD